MSLLPRAVSEITGDEVDIHGPAGGGSHMFINDAGKHFVKHINDMSYVL